MRISFIQAKHKEIPLNCKYNVVNTPYNFLIEQINKYIGCAIISYFSRPFWIIISENMSIKVCKTDESAQNVCQARTLIGRICKQWFRKALSGDKWAKAGFVY